MDEIRNFRNFLSIMLYQYILFDCLALRRRVIMIFVYLDAQFHWNGQDLGRLVEKKKK